MNLHGIVALIGGMVGLVGGVAGILSLLHQRKQTALFQDQLGIMREKLQTEKQQEDTVTDLARKFDEAAAAIMKVSRATIQTGASTSKEAYPYVFPNEELRRRIEIYIGRRRFFGGFRPCTLTREQLQNPVVQKTIQDVLDAVVQFKADHTDYARALKLLAPK